MKTTITYKDAAYLTTSALFAVAYFLILDNMLFVRGLDNGAAQYFALSVLSVAVFIHGVYTMDKVQLVFNKKVFVRIIGVLLAGFVCASCDIFLYFMFALPVFWIPVTKKLVSESK